jgi:hypothetical protein
MLSLVLRLQEEALADASEKESNFSEDRNTSKLILEQRFIAATKAFEEKCSSFVHKKCSTCNIVSMQEIFAKENMCRSCANFNRWTSNYDDMVPSWIGEDGKRNEYVPEVLTRLSEGEKLLIQQISMYVPLQHLMYGQIGAKGHIVSFPQDIYDVCRALPRLPEQVQWIRVVKHFKGADGELSSKSFRVKKTHVLEALEWLQKHNPLYQNVKIEPSNLDWITNGIEQELPASVYQKTDVESEFQAANEDRGPSEEQVAKIADKNPDIEQAYGSLAEFNKHLPKEKDEAVINAILNAETQGKVHNNGGKRKYSTVLERQIFLLYP